MRISSALLLAVVLGGCTMPSKPTPQNVTDIAASLSYFHDERTGVCFAVTSSYVQMMYISSIATVPCSDKVRALITGSQAQ